MSINFKDKAEFRNGSDYETNKKKFTFSKILKLKSN